MTKLSPLNARDVINYARPDSYSTGRPRAATRSGTIRSLKEGRQLPNHPGTDIHKGTLKAIIDQSGLSTDEYMSL